MLRIKYNNCFLTLSPGSTIEMERNSPLFQLDVVQAEYTMPLTIVYENQNVLLLGDVFFEYGIKSKIKIDVEVYDDISYRYRCILVVDKTLVNKTQIGKGNVQGYLLTGTSDFFNTIKDVKMIDMQLGGSDTYPFTTWDPFDNSNGFWQKVHDTWINDNYNYVFTPIRNESWIEEPGFSGWMNQLWPGNGTSGAEAPGQIIPFTWPVPMPKLKNVLQILFAELGWQLDTTGLNDNHWQKIILLNINPIKITESTAVDVDGVPIITPVASIKVELRKMFSPEVLVSDFIMEHCKRYGWAPIFVSESRTCYLIALKEVGITSTTKDFTKYAAPEIQTDYSAKQRTFSYKNSFTGNDGAISSPEFTNFTIRNPVYRKSALPVPSAEYDNSLFYTFHENCYWKIGVDTITNTREWQKHTDNIYDEEAKNSTDDFSSNVTTLPAILTEYSTRTVYVLSVPTPEKYYGFFPYCKQPRNKQWGLRNLFYLGMVSDIKADDTGGTLNYPYAADTIALPIGTKATGWSNVFTHKDGINDYGIIATWFKIWTTLLKVNTPIERKLYLPLHELEQLRWQDIINISNQPFLIQKYIYPIPYPGYIQATLHPIALNAAETVSTVPSTALPYVRFAFEEEADAPDVVMYGITFWTAVRRAKPIIRCYSDAAGTIPFAPTNLKIYLTEQTSGDDIAFTDADQYSVVISAAVYNTATADMLSVTSTTNTRYAQSDLKYQRRGTSSDIGSGTLYIKYRIDASADYVVI